MENNPKREYRVIIKEVHRSTRIVQASSEVEALDLAEGAQEEDLEYSFTLSRDQWEVELVEPG